MSALAQIEVRYEVIVIDDGSTDGTAEVAAAMSPAVRVVRHGTNRGLPAARNTGIRESRYNLVAFLDADDWWVPNKLAIQATAFAAAADLGVVFSDFRGVDPAGQPAGWQGGLASQLPGLGLRLLPLSQDVFRLDGLVAHALIRHTSFMHPSTVVVRRSAVDDAGPFDESLRHMEDLEMWIRLSTRCSVAFVTHLLAIVEQRPNSLGRQSVRADEYLIRLYADLPRRVPDMSAELLDHVRGVLAVKHAGLGWHYRTAGDRPTARRHYWASLQYQFRARTLAALARSFFPASQSTGR
jgi:glycosyltransferase involved in cell wall biosynthesis